jgi:hypothetical protein
MRNVIKLFAVIAAVSFGACDNPYDPSGPAVDPDAPRVHITTPAFGTIAGDVKTVTVTGTVTDDSGVDSVKVNDVTATVGSDGTFTADVPVHAGTNLLHAIALDKQGNAGKETRAVVAGPQATLNRQITNAITATLSAQTIDAVARGAANYIQNGDLTAAVAPMNPVVNAGAPDGPDCLYGQARITSMDVGTADIVMAPQNGGIFMSAELRNLKVGMHLQWAVACADGSRDITISASKISVQGMLKVGVSGRDFDISLTNQNVDITGFDLDLGGIPGTIVDMLHLDTAMGPILGFATERFVVPMLNKTLAGLNEVKTVDLFGRQVDIDVKPQSVTFTREGGTVLLNTTMRAKQDTGTFVYVSNTTPIMDMSHGFQLAVADDAANQLVTSLWSAKGLDATLDLKTGSYGTIGQLYDSVEISAKVPPFVDASGEKLMMTVGDMVASFKLAGSVTTAVAINAEVALEIINDADGALRFDVGDPTVYVDVLDDGVEGSNILSNSEFEDIVSFALSRIVAVGSGTVGAVPLPSFGGVAVTSLSIDEQFGYLVVNGEVQ